MKTLTRILIILCSLQIIGNAQTWDEWFVQRKTQEKYLVQQVAVLKAYLEYLKAGYHIARTGLNTIGDIQEGNFEDHNTYLLSRRKVNPVVGQIADHVSAEAYQQHIAEALSSLLRDVTLSNQLKAGEKEYLERVRKNVLDHCAASVAAAQQIMTADHAQLTDDERIAQIKTIQDDLSQQYAFTISFYSATRLLIAQKQREKLALIRSKYLNAAVYD